MPNGGNNITIYKKASCVEHYLIILPEPQYALVLKRYEPREQYRYCFNPIEGFKASKD